MQIFVILAKEVGIIYNTIQYLFLYEVAIILNDLEYFLLKICFPLIVLYTGSAIYR